MINLTRITSHQPAILTKQFNYVDGDLKKISGGNMTHGEAATLSLQDVNAFAELLTGLQPNQALAYGLCGRESIRVATSNSNAVKNGEAIARSREFFNFSESAGIMLLDYDPEKGQRALTRDELLQVLADVIPGFKDCAHIWYTSSSSHIHDTETDEDLTGLRGQRVYILVQDASDIPRAGKALEAALWAAGHGFYAVSRAGSLLPRTLVDCSVWQPERLDFAAGAYCGEGLEQRRGEPVVHEGRPLDTATLLPDDEADQQQAAQAKAEAAKAIKPKAEKIRGIWLDEQADKQVGKNASDDEKQAARSQLKRSLEHDVLFGDFEITVIQRGQPVAVNVGTVLDNPEKYHKLSVRDPLEPEYNNFHACGILYLQGGKPCLYSQAHGGKNYQLKRKPEDDKPEPTEKAPGQNQMADIVARHLNGELLYDAVINEWYEKMGLTWRPCTDIHAEAIIEAAITRERDSFAYAYLSGVAKFLRIRLALEQWADDENLLPMANGILNLKTNQLEPTGSRVFNWQLPHQYIESDSCPIIEGWLNQVTQGNQELINLLYAWMYAVLTGRADLQKYVELIGHGGTGKSTFIRLCIQLVGDNNSVTTDLKSLEQSRFETAVLYGKRLALITDSNAYGGSVDILKALTGQDPIRRERKNKDPSTFTFGGMVMIAANQPIQSKDYTSGLSRRRIPVQFNYRVTEADKARYPNGIESEMQKEIPGLINKLLAMGESILEHIRNPSPTINQFKMDAELDTNPLLAWLNEHLVITEGGETQSSDLYESYRQHCESNGHNPVASNKFAGLLVDNATMRGIDTEKAKNSAIRYFKNLRLRLPGDTECLLFERSVTGCDGCDTKRDGLKRLQGGAVTGSDGCDGVYKTQNFSTVINL